MRGALVLFFAASLAATVAAAFPAPANADATAVQRAYLAVRVNGKDVGASLVVLSEGDALVAADVLQNAGVVVPDAAIVLLEGRRYASVKRLDPAATFEVDADAVALNVTLPATRFATQQIDAGDEGTAVPIAHDRSAFLNYAVAKSTSGSVALSGELAATVAGGVADAVLAQSPTGRFTASAYSWTADDLKRKRRLTLGRAIIGETGFSALGSATAIDGVLLEHTRGTNPYWVHQSGAGYAGLASTPSSLEVYVNGVLVQRQDLAPGPFRIENLPLDSGANQTQIVVRDGLGNVRVVRQSLYLDQNLLNRGDRDYTFGAGRLVNAANGAGPLLVSGAYSYGLRSTLTAGLRADVTNGLENVAGRVEAATKLGRIIGLLGLSSAAPNAQLFTAPVYAFVGNVLQLQTPAPNGASSAGGR
ncbi:MAG: fimbria/pilus outer membrane usher protein, partial [Candidatus Eremiobacteraeota bacterium]|nr:fimbria/pilus outer membrane usher protein [Candidatus Eremiobacteraeota bacterium]